MARFLNRPESALSASTRPSERRSSALHERSSRTSKIEVAGKEVMELLREAARARANNDEALASKKIEEAFAVDVKGRLHLRTTIDSLCDFGWLTLWCI